MNSLIHTTIEPLIREKIFNNEEEALQEILREYIIRQILNLQKEIKRFEKKYGMRFERFKSYLHERSVLLQSDTLSGDERRVLGQAIMQEENDFLDWKANQEILDSWIGIRKEVKV